MYIDIDAVTFLFLDVEISSNIVRKKKRPICLNNFRMSKRYLSCCWEVDDFNISVCRRLRDWTTNLMEKKRNKYCMFARRPVALRDCTASRLFLGSITHIVGLEIIDSFYYMWWVYLAQCWPNFYVGYVLFDKRPEYFAIERYKTRRQKNVLVGLLLVFLSFSYYLVSKCQQDISSIRQATDTYFKIFHRLMGPPRTWISIFSKVRFWRFLIIGLSWSLRIRTSHFLP